MNELERTVASVTAPGSGVGIWEWQARRRERPGLADKHMEENRRNKKINMKAGGKRNMREKEIKKSARDSRTKGSSTHVYVKDF